MEESPLSPHLAAVGLYDNPVSFEGFEILGECHFGAWAGRIEELVMNLSYCMGPCGTVESCGAVSVTCKRKLSYINENDKSGQAEGSSANILYVRPIGVIMTTEVMNPPPRTRSTSFEGFSTSRRRPSVETFWLDDKKIIH